MNLVNKVQVRILRLPHATDLPWPAYQTAHAAGLDLVAAVPEPVIIAPDGRAAIPTGFAFALPLDVEGQIRPRSGLALHHGVTVLNSPGTLDADYRGEVHVILANFGDTSFAVARGARIAQLVFAPTMQAAIREVASLDETTRGIRGFGSTGTADLTFDWRKRIALHEASHAVAARAYGIAVDFAEVGAIRDGPGLGRVNYASWDDPACDESAWAKTVVALAGPSADVVFYSGQRIEGADTDFEHARQSAQRVDPRNSRDVIRQAWSAALKIIRDNRTVISCLAAVLERNDRLSGPEIDGIVGSISGKVRPPVTYERPPC